MKGTFENEDHGRCRFPGVVPIQNSQAETDGLGSCGHHGRGSGSTFEIREQLVRVLASGHLEREQIECEEEVVERAGRGGETIAEGDQSACGLLRVSHAGTGTGTRLAPDELEVLRRVTDERNQATASSQSLERLAGAREIGAGGETESGRQAGPGAQPGTDSRARRRSAGPYDRHRFQTIEECDGVFKLTHLRVKEYKELQRGLCFRLKAGVTEAAFRASQEPDRLIEPILLPTEERQSA